MKRQNPGRRGRNCEFVLKKGETTIKSFQTMGSIARFLKVCITTILNTVNEKRVLKGFTIECLKKTPNYVKIFDANGKLISKFETISDAAKALKKTRKGNLSSLESAISFAIRTETLRFGYWWRRDGFKKPLTVVINHPIQVQKKICSYVKYNEDNDPYKKCGRIFISEGNHNHYCPSCRNWIDNNTQNIFVESLHKVSKFYEE